MRTSLILGMLLLCWAAQPAPAINITGIAAGTTIAVNLLEIKANIAKVRAAAKATKRVTVKVAKKVADK